MTVATVESPVGFSLPGDLEADGPPEARGIARDGVRLLVARPDGIEHVRFRALGRFLEPGDLVVVNTSAMLPSALEGRRGDGRPVVVHLARPLRAGEWAIELRRPDGAGPERDGRPGETVVLPAGVELTLLGPYLTTTPTRLWRARPRIEGPVEGYLERYGRPVTYGYVRDRVPAGAYATVFGCVPGSAEMPSAGRPFSDALVTDLVARGVALAPVVLHTGVSSPEADEPPAPERFDVPESTAALVEHTRQRGGRVVAVGTTVVRALESAVDDRGRVVAAGGETGLVLGPDRPARVVDGLVTGWHAPGASHLLLIEAVAGRRLVRTAYDAALEHRYLWHEFGDSCLLLPSRAGRGSRVGG